MIWVFISFKNISSGVSPQFRQFRIVAVTCFETSVLSTKRKMFMTATVITMNTTTKTNNATATSSNHYYTLFTATMLFNTGKASEKPER